MIRFARVLIPVVVLTLVMSLMPSRTAEAQIQESVPTAELDPTFAAEWMDLLYHRIMAEGYNPPAAARMYAYAGVALYESVVWGIPTNRSLGGQLNGLGGMPFPEAAEYDWTTVAHEALRTVLNGLMFEATQETHAAFNDFHHEQIGLRAETIAEDVINRSVEYGENIAKKLLEWADADGYRETRNREYTFPTGVDWFWVATNPDLPALEPYWGEVRTFGMTATDVCDVDMNMEFSTEQDSTFYQQALEVMNVGDDLVAEQRDIATYWLDNLSATGTPAGHWVLIENQMVDHLNLTLDVVAQMYGMTNMAMADAFTACWAIKYREPLLRPETYINRYISPAWRSYITTPMFPEYPSGHSVVSAAAAEMLTNLFGQVAFTDTAKLQFDMAARSFTSFDAAAQEAAISRIYGGIHFRTAVENGMDIGRCVTQHLLDNLVMNQVTQGE